MHGTRTCWTQIRTDAPSRSQKQTNTSIQRFGLHTIAAPVEQHQGQHKCEAAPGRLFRDGEDVNARNSHQNVHYTLHVNCVECSRALHEMIIKADQGLLWIAVVPVVPVVVSFTSPANNNNNRDTRRERRSARFRFDTGWCVLCVCMAWNAHTHALRNLWQSKMGKWDICVHMQHINRKREVMRTPISHIHK